MNMIKKEIIEIGVPGFIAAFTLALLSYSLKMLDSYSEMSLNLFFSGILFLTAIALSSYFGAAATVLDREKGSFAFLMTLPAPKHHLWIQKTSIALIICALTHSAYYLFAPHIDLSQYVSVLVLSFVLSNVFGLSLPKVIVAGSAGFATGFACLVTCEIIRLEWHFTVTTLNISMFIISMIILGVEYIILKSHPAFVWRTV